MKTHFAILCLFLFALQLQAKDGFLFTENKGQWPDQVAFQADLPGGKLYFENDRWTYYLYKLPHGHGEPINPEIDYKAHVFSFNLLNANPAPNIVGSYRQKQYKNYFLGDDPNKWAGRVGVFEAIDYESVYDNVDLKVYNSATGLKYDFLVAPNGNPDDIKLRYDDLYRVHLEDGKLVLEHRFGFIEEQKPYAYQFKDGVLCEVECAFVLDGTEVRFQLGDYDPEYKLVIDPALIFSTYSGATSDNWGYTATYDDQGNLYGGGAVFGASYPTTSGAFDLNSSAAGTSTDIGISKFSSDGTQLIYSTFIGGNDSDLAHSLIVNSNNELIVFGTSGSSNYPTTTNAYDDTFAGGNGVTVTDVIDFVGGSDIILTVLSADGSSLVGSTFFGGSANDGLNTTGISSLQFNYGDHARGEVIIDAANNVYIGSVTRSSNITGTNGSFQSSFGGDTDGIIAKFNPTLSSLIWASYVGGNDDDCVNSLKLDSGNNLYATGGTASDNFNTGSGFDNTFNGGQSDGYLLKIANNGSSIMAGTFLGTNQYDQGFFVEVDEEDLVYVVGQSMGSYVVTADVYSNSGSHQFIHCFDNDLANTEFSTVFGSGGSRVDMSPTAFLVDFCGRIYVSGWGGSANETYNSNGAINISGMPVSGNAFKSSTDGSDLYFITLEKEAATLIYGSYFGGNGVGEHVDGGTSRFDKDGKIYQAVCAGCGGSDDFPTTTGAWSNDNGSTNCNLGVFRFNFEPNLIKVNALFTPSLTGCAPYELVFTDDSNRGEDYFWDFGDGTTSTEENPPPHVYEDLGTYEVSLVVVDSSACNIADSIKLTVEIPEFSQEVIADFEADVPGWCEGFTVSFTNTSILEEDDDQYIWTWDHGDGSDDLNLTQDHDYTYDEPGDYTVELIVNTGSPCFDSDSTSFSFNIPDQPFVEAEVEVGVPTCVNQSVEFNAVQNAEDYFWILEDGTTVDGPTVTQTYTTSGNYSIDLVAIDPNTCNLQDTLTYEFEIFDLPSPGFVLLTPNACTGEIIALENQSSGDHDLESVWTVNGNTVSTDNNPSFSVDQAGIVDVCVTSTDTVTGCDATFCEDVEVKDFSLLMPTAFSPNGDGVNDVLRAFGEEVENIQLTLYNRWGEMVYDSNIHSSVGWSGKANGEDQEISVYAYILKGINSCESEVTQFGNVTLIR